MHLVEVDLFDPQFQNISFNIIRSDYLTSSEKQQSILFRFLAAAAVFSQQPETYS